MRFERGVYCGVPYLVVGRLEFSWGTPSRFSWFEKQWCGCRSLDLGLVGVTWLVGPHRHAR